MSSPMDGATTMVIYPDVGWSTTARDVSQCRHHDATINGIQFLGRISGDVAITVDRDREQRANRQSHRRQRARNARFKASSSESILSSREEHAKRY